MNILPATMAEGGRATLADGRGIALPPLAAAPPAGTPLSIGIRPENIAIGDAPGALSFTIAFLERLGGLATRIIAASGGMAFAPVRSAERRGGKAGVSTCR